MWKRAIPGDPGAQSLQAFHKVAGLPKHFQCKQNALEVFLCLRIVGLCTGRQRPS